MSTEDRDNHKELFWMTHHEDLEQSFQPQEVIGSRRKATSHRRKFAI